MIHNAKEAVNVAKELAPSPPMHERTASGLAGLPRGLIHRMRELAYSCLYVLGPEAARPVKIGYATNIFDRYSSLQGGNPQQLRVHFIEWTPGRRVAARIEIEVHRLLDIAGRRIRGEWFDVSATQGRDAIRIAATNLNLRLFSHQEMIRRCGFQHEKELVEEFSSASYRYSVHGDVSHNEEPKRKPREK
ncbi:MAG: GIY-YIG nuclease family protein [Alphaproteobacteria bacterium]|nr:GIY-YIG nuclease family protein [Alphaproteobacteria bacterium]MDE2631022.1 GIY-YIG nuclease family protein [Alphaproteobacteria bacterium]